MPARDAVRELTAQGLLVQNNRTVRVGPLRARDIIEMHEIDALMHGLAAQQAADRATASDAAILRDFNDRLRDAFDTGNPALATELNWRFHRTINAAGASPRLFAMLRMTNTPREYVDETLARNEEILAEHGAIVDAIAANDALGARDAAYRHIRSAADDIIVHLRKLQILDED